MSMLLIVSHLSVYCAKQHFNMKVKSMPFLYDETTCWSYLWESRTMSSLMILLQVIPVTSQHFDLQIDLQFVTLIYSMLSSLNKTNTPTIRANMQYLWLSFKCRHVLFDLIKSSQLISHILCLISFFRSLSITQRDTQWKCIFCYQDRLGILS